MSRPEDESRGTLGLAPREDQQGLRLLSDIPRPESENIQLSYGGKVVIVDGRVILSYVGDKKTGGGILVIDRELTEPVIIEKKDKLGTRKCVPYSESELTEKRGKFRGLFMLFNAESPVIYIGERYKLIYIGTGENDSSIAFTLESTDPIRSQKVDYPPVRPDIALHALRGAQNRR